MPNSRRKARLKLDASAKHELSAMALITVVFEASLEPLRPRVSLVARNKQFYRKLPGFHRVLNEPSSSTPLVDPDITSKRVKVGPAASRAVLLGRSE